MANQRGTDKAPRIKGEITIDELLDLKADKTGDCWIWQASKYWDGYGRQAWNGKQDRIHRIVLMEKLGISEIPKGMVVRHECNNPSCCNPEHLSLGTHKENMQDMVRHGTSKNCGRKPGDKNLTEEQRISILNTEGNKFDVAKKNNVSVSTVERIRRTYKVSEAA